MITLLLLFLLFVAAGLPAVTAQDQPAPRKIAQNRPRGVEMEVRDADLQFAKDTAARRIDGWMDAFADDAVVIAAGQTVEGKKAIREFFTPLFANKDYTLTWSPTRVETSTEGTLGYTYGNYEQRLGANVRHGMYLTVWRKVDGKWKVALDMGSPLPEPGKP
jgi:ketosteroid isomerase-like protein